MKIEGSEENPFFNAMRVLIALIILRGFTVQCAENFFEFKGVLLQYLDNGRLCLL